MRNRFLLTVLGLILTCSTTFASIESKIEKVIKTSGINPSAVTVSVREVGSGEKLVNINDSQPMIPASTQKLLTFPVILETLGTDYIFETGFYQLKNGDLHLKLSADPYFTSSNLKSLIKTLKSNNIKTCKEFYIDDKVIDDEEWGEGWQWDNDLNPLMQRYSVYNMDYNLLILIARATEKGRQADVSLKNFYPITIMNLVKTGDEDNIKLSRNNNISPDILKVEGTVATQVIKTFPVNNPKRYFMLQLDRFVKDRKLDYYGNYPSKAFVKGSEKLVLGEVKHTIAQTGADILKNSNNFATETIYKIAGGKFKNSVGTTDFANEMFFDYCEKNGLDTSNIRLVDGSGVSKNNIMTSDFVTAFLVNETKKPNAPVLLTLMAKPGEGTLANRMLYFQDKMRAKTGTLSDVSAIAGYLETKKGNRLAFDIMINDHKMNNVNKKLLEENILRAIFTDY